MSTRGLHRVVVVGGGAGGSELISFIGRKLVKKGICQASLVDRYPTHIWKPRLHEVATGVLNTGEDEMNYFAHAYRNNYTFQMGRMRSLDRDAKTITLAPIFQSDDLNTCLVRERKLHYDTLVMAVGAITNDFGTPGVNEHCFFLNTPADGERLRRRILGQTMSVVTGNAGVDKVRIGIVGGGATGVELAAEIHHTIAQLHHYGSNLKSDQLEVSILEGANRILLMGTEQLSNFAKLELEKRNICVRLNTSISGVTPTGFILADGNEIPAEIKIWTAGNKAPDWLKSIGLPVNRVNQILVNEFLLSEDPSIFAIGDCSCAPWVEMDKRFLPATAQVAHEEAEWLAQAIAKKITGKPIKRFVFHPRGVVVSLGKKQAVGNVQAIAGSSQSYAVQGRNAKHLYTFLYRMHQAVLYGWPRMLILWLGDKLRKIAKPPIKLH